MKFREPRFIDNRFIIDLFLVAHDEGNELKSSERKRRSFQKLKLEFFPFKNYEVNLRTTQCISIFMFV